MIFLRTLLALLGTAIASPILAQATSTAQSGIAAQATLPASRERFPNGAMARSRIAETRHELDSQDKSAMDESLSIGAQYSAEREGSRDDHEARLRALDREARRGTISPEVYAAQVRRILGTTP